MITTKAVMDSLLEHAADVELLAVLSRPGCRWPLSTGASQTRAKRNAQSRQETH